MSNEFYVYVYVDPRKASTTVLGLTLPGEPFYVGKGKGKRAQAHLKESLERTHNTLKVQKIKRIQESGHEPIIIKVVEHAEQSEAWSQERIWIEAIGTKWNIRGVIRGPLTNMTSGGDGGATVCEELRKKVGRVGKANGMWGKTHTVEARARISEFRQSFTHSEATKQNMSKKRNTAEYIAKRSFWWTITKPDNTTIHTNGLKATCAELGLNYNSLYNSYSRGTPIIRGSAAGFTLQPMQINELESDFACSNALQGNPSDNR